jgi:transposase InsO family protein
VIPNKSKNQITSYLEKENNKQVPVSWLIKASGLSKNGWYHKAKEKKDNTPIKQKIEKVLIESPYYGYKRVTMQLRKTGEIFNHKKIYKIMGEYHLLQVRKSRKVPRTTNSRHNLTVYVNEIKYLGIVLPKWVWVSDITYVWVGTGFAYLALIMDQMGKKIVGWAMGLSLHRELCIEALNMALKENQAPKYHHSDRGVQYCSGDYIDILKKNNIVPSMADVGVSVDNPYAESLNRSIKVEEVYLHAYESFAEAKSSIQKYIEVYNTIRLHSSLGYMSPTEYEKNYQLKNSLKFPNLESQIRG